MLVKILSKSASFKGVSYNTDKIDKNKGELMKVANFGPLQGIAHLRPEDYRNYLKMLSAQNKRVSQPQFHATISAKGRSYDKIALTAIASEWMATMGYGKQPYLVVFHKDTANNHVHIVSTRVDRNGKKISSGFENIRAIQNMNKVLGTDEKYSAKQDIANALSYRFSTKAQFMMILESQGYSLKETDGKLEVIKFGVKQGDIALTEVNEKIKNYHADTERKTQLKAIFHKYARIYDTGLKNDTIPLPGNYGKKSGGYSSEFSACLKEKFGITLLYHASGDKPPYGYSIIDNAGKAVFKGGEIMALPELLEMPTGKQYFKEEDTTPNTGFFDQETGPELRAYYAAILKAAIYNYPDLVQGLQHQGLAIINKGNHFTLADQGAQVFIDISELLDEKDYRHLVEVFVQSAEMSDEAYRQYNPIPGISIASDIDDEAVYGRNRRRKKQARTNTR